MAVKEITLTKTPVSAPSVRLVRGDNDSTLLRMNVDRYDGGVDLAELTWMVNVVNAEGEYDAFPLQSASVSDDRITVEWLIGGTATGADGETKFELEGVRGDGAVVWQSGYRVLMIYPDISGFPQDAGEAELTEIAQLIEYVGNELPAVLAARDAANLAAQNPPKPGNNGNWWLWDAETSEYVDSGRPWTGSADGSVPGVGLPYVSAEDDGKVAMVVDGSWQAAELPLFDGTYTVTPSAEGAVVLAAAQKLMDANVVVEKIPFAEVTNSANGKTATIG